MDAAENGLAALEAAVRARPSLLLLDMRMALMNGWELAAQLKAVGLEIPIVVMTASEAASEVAAEIDATDWVGKPYNLEDLLRAIRTNLSPAA